jgi:predicted metal-dependent enzyme (double-stranded beta helix superfamily)
MPDSSQALAAYVNELLTIAREETSEIAIVERVAPCAQAFAATPGLVSEKHYVCDEEQGFALHLLHEEADHSLAVFILAWLPGRGTPVHNHKTWGVVVGIDGEETDTSWERLDDGKHPGYAKLARMQERRIGPGQTSCVLSEDIHRVDNRDSQTSLSLHTYGMHINFTGRSEFDPDANTESKFVVTVD